MASTEPTTSAPETGRTIGGISLRNAVIGSVAVIAVCALFGHGHGGDARSIVDAHPAADTTSTLPGDDPLAAVALPANSMPPQGWDYARPAGTAPTVLSNETRPDTAQQPVPGTPAARQFPAGPLAPGLLPGGPPRRVAPDPADLRPVPDRTAHVAPPARAPTVGSTHSSDATPRKDSGPLSRGLSSLGSSDADGDRANNSNGTAKSGQQKRTRRGLGDGQALSGLGGL